MQLGNLLDGAIAPLAPRWAANRVRARAELAAANIAADAVRRYDAASFGRRTSGWDRRPGSIDFENMRGRALLGWAGHDLVRNNKYAAAAVGQLVSMLWGDGIALQAIHPVKFIQRRAQDELDRFAESKVDGFGDWYGHGKVSVREMIVGGETGTLWREDAGGPDGRVQGMEGAQIDMMRTFPLADGGKVVQGVQYDKGGDRVAYWLFDQHPNDVLPGNGLYSHPVPAQYFDHMFERLRHGQSRGASWLGAVAMTLHDINDIADAKRLQAKVQACLSLIIQPPEGQDGSPLGPNVPDGADANGVKPLGEAMSPGMIARTKPGETVAVVNPTPAADTVAFLKHELGGISANLVPYHLMTGDVSQANYTGLRAALNGAYARIGDWQQNEVIPLLCRPMGMRRMRRLAMQTGDPRYLAVRFGAALPRRMIVDPMKDLLPEIIEMRAGLKTLSQSLAERGLNTDAHLAELADMNARLDALKLVLEMDPRKLTDTGILQAAAGGGAKPGTDPLKQSQGE
jgi:lambda family phage portal protein